MNNYQELLKDYPLFMTPLDLVEAGLYISTDAAYLARMRGHGPSFVKLKHKVLYPKTAIIKFLEQRTTP